MNYEDTIKHLYEQTAVYEHSGGDAYKPGLDTSNALDEILGHPHKAYRTIHIAGTNGKGSVSHLIAAVLQRAGYTVGLYTSPHLVDFRERIRVNGQKITEEYVTDFVEKWEDQYKHLSPSFFELTSTMAFDYFRSMDVDFAVIEAGLGGRLDSTNIITPVLSIITSISFDHTQFLGNTHEMIAYEKAGIIKEGVPVVVADIEDVSAMQVIKNTAKLKHAPFHSPTIDKPCLDVSRGADGWWMFITREWGVISGELAGLAQRSNSLTVFTALQVLNSTGINITEKAVNEGFMHVVKLTGLMGRWQRVHERPVVIVDTGHNLKAWEYIRTQLMYDAMNADNLRVVVGFSADKDIKGMLQLIPEEAICYFCAADSHRALPAEELKDLAALVGRAGKAYLSVQEAVVEAINSSSPDDIVFVGGSNYVVGETIPLFSKTIHDF